MQPLVDNLPWLAAMAVLVCFSAFFSASEAALFCLRWADRRALASGTRAQQMAEGLLRDPDRLLSAVLFWNLATNIVYFAIASVVGLRLEEYPQINQAGVAAFVVASLLIIIFFSEMVPKSLAVMRARSLASLVGIPLAAAVRLVDPVMPALRFVNLLSRRLIWPGLEEEPYLEVGDLERAIELSRADADLAEQERMVLRRIISLSDIRVEEWMRPRNQCHTFRLPISSDDLADQLTPSGYLLISDADGGDIISAIDLRELSDLDPSRLQRHAEDVVYVPWCGTVADALQELEEKDTHVAAIVNELGETVGILTQEDIMETIFADRHERAERLLRRHPLEEVEPGIWQIAGVTNLRRISRLFDVKLPASRHVTVGGIVQEALERLPIEGDRCQWGPFQFEVLRVDAKGDLLLRMTRLSDEETAS